MARKHIHTVESASQPVAMASGTGSAGSSGQCSSDCLLELNGKCITETAPMGWNEAEAECVTRGGHLVSVHSRAEHDALIAATSNVGNKRRWLGLSDQEREGVHSVQNSDSWLSFAVCCRNLRVDRWFRD